MNRFAANRRRLLKVGAAAAVAAPFVSALQACASRRYSTVGQRAPVASPYGALRPVADLASGLPLLKLPEGFRYRSFSWTGDPMSDGQPTPDRHDGMAVIAERGGGSELVLVRNHEVGVGRLIRASGQYDSAKVSGGGRPGGGTTNLYFRRRHTAPLRAVWRRCPGS